MGLFGDLAAIRPHLVWGGVTARAVEGEQAMLCTLELAPGGVVPEHSHPNEQLGILVRGSLTFRAGGETRELGPGGTWCIPANLPHEVEVGPEGAVAIEIFSPPRADWAALERGEPSAPAWP